METTLCQKCFHYEACKSIDLTGAVENPADKNAPCDYFIDADRVKIQDRANWVEHVHRYSDGDAHVTYRCSHCGELERVKCYSAKEWNNYYSEHYQDVRPELHTYCNTCGSVINGIVENPRD